MKHFIPLLLAVLLSGQAFAGKSEQLRHTITVDLPDSYGTPVVTTVKENMFGVQTGGKWYFYNIGGTLVHLIDRGKFNSQNPGFDSGALVMEDLSANARFFNPYVILYANGSRKKLPTEWFSVTDFVDGVAMAKTSAGMESSVFFINTQGEVIWPHLKESGKGQFQTYPVRPLRDNRRAFKKDGKWGFLDNRGNIVIQPQFLNVRDFSEGYAGVTTTVNGKPMIGFINQAGEFTFPPTILKGFSTWDYNVGDVHSGRIRVKDNINDKVKFYNTTGECLKIFGGTCTEFLPGNVAWVEPDEDNKEHYIYVLSPNFDIVTKLDNSQGAWGIHDNPVFASNGWKSGFWGREIISSNGGRVITGVDDFSDNLGDSYAYFNSDVPAYCYAELVIDKTKYYGIIGQNGNYVLTFNRPTQPAEWRETPK